MAIAVNSQEASNVGARGTSSGIATVWAFNNVAGTKLLLCLVVSSNGAVAITSGPTYGGVAMTAIGSLVTWDSGQALTRWYYLDSPATGSNNFSVTATGSGGFALIGGGISFTGAATGIGTATSGAAGAANTTATAGNITTATGNYIVAGGGWGSGTGGTAGSGFTRTWLKNGSGITGGDNGLAEYKSSVGGATTPTFTWTGSDVWGIQAVEILAAANSNTDPPFQSFGGQPMGWNTTILSN